MWQTQTRDETVTSDAKRNYECRSLMTLPLRDASAKAIADARCCSRSRLQLARVPRTPPSTTTRLACARSHHVLESVSMR